ncbi:MAG: hypothetical protein ABSF65_11730 [Candidatus Bathyarchaeia archaeon]
MTAQTDVGADRTVSFYLLLSSYNHIFKYNEICTIENKQAG